MTRPEPIASDRVWAENLVRTAERTFNARDVAAIMAGYSPDAVLDVCSEGLRERYAGASAIEQAWRTMFAVFPRMQLAKQLVAADPDGAIVNTWTGSVDGTSHAYGLDLWWLDRSKRVTRHEVISFGRVVSPRSLAGGLRWAMIHPRSIVRMLRALR